MPQASTHNINKTVYETGNSQNVPPRSASVRLRGLTRDSYVEIDEIAWGVRQSGDEGALADFDFAALQILRNEIFDVNFVYGGANVGDVKDVVFHDQAVRNRRWRFLRFKNPMKLNDASDYLIIVPVPIRNGDPGAPYQWALTVRGRFVVNLQRTVN